MTPKRSQDSVTLKTNLLTLAFGILSTSGVLCVSVWKTAVRTQRSSTPAFEICSFRTQRWVIWTSTLLWMGCAGLRLILNTADGVSSVWWMFCKLFLRETFPRESQHCARLPIGGPFNLLTRQSQAKALWSPFNKTGLKTNKLKTFDQTSTSTLSISHLLSDKTD